MFISGENFKLLKRIISLLKPYTKKIVIILSLILISSVVSLLLPLISAMIMDKGLLAKDFGMIIKLVLISFFLYVFDHSLGIMETRYQSYISSIMPYSLSKSAFKKLLKLKIQYFNNVNIAEIINNIGMDVGNISKVSDRITFLAITLVFKMLGGAVGLFILDWKLAILVLLIIPFRYILAKFLAKKRQKLFEDYMENNRQFSSWYGDAVGGIKEIKLWGIERIKTGEFIKKHRRIVKNNIRMSVLDKINEISESLLFVIFTNTIYILGAWMIFNNSLTIGALVAFITYSAYVTGPIAAILNIGYDFSSIFPSAKRFFEFLDMECEAVKPIGNGEFDIKSVKGGIQFENVSFSYNPEEIVLKKINFEAHPGEKVAIVGANGSGKSTIANLILRFHTPDSGRILLDGIDSRNINLRDYRSIISVVSQEVYLFDTSIRENITLGRKMDDLTVYKAARDSRANEFIETMPDKYESQTGTDGMNLSGGERQKIAVARSFARDSKIMILDEATSNYDVESSELFNDLLKIGMKDRTIFIITHNPKVLNKVDKVIVIENGIITGIGTHDELRFKNKFYMNMIRKPEGSENVV